MISVVIPLYNKEKSVRATLESVRAQSYTDWECIVVDDGSTDKSLNVVQDYIRRVNSEELIVNSIHVIHKENGGVCSARNRGIEEAKGEYIALLDGDDQWDKEYLAEQVKMIRDFPEAAMWGINFAELNHGKLIRKLETDLPDGYRGYVENYFQMPKRISDLFCSSSVVIRRKTFDMVGMFDERIKYSEDSDMWFRIIANNPVAFYDKYMVWYLYDAENRAMNRTRLLKYWLPYFVEKYKDPLFRHNEAFYRWIMRWAGVRIKQIYFNDPTQHADAKVAARKLDYTQLPFKYRFELLTPYWIGKIVYKILK
jgi:glycosyltransferase involved in cell wall biosynthesis